MTIPNSSRPPKRRKPAMRLHWSIHVFAASALLTVAVWFSIPANAGTGDREVRRYAASAATAICSVLDDYPTLPGVRGVLQGIKNDSGFGDYEVGEVLALAVQQDCPRFLPLLERFVTVYGVSSV